MEKLSFDFDSTLSRTVIQDYAKELIESEHDVWIVTSRLHESNTQWPDYNNDLYKVADELGIPKDKIVFTNGQPKHQFVSDLDFLWHLDDDWLELKEIQRFTKVKPISCFGSSTWKNKCNRIINGKK